MSIKKRINWIANQPTPFHHYFHTEVKQHGQIDFRVYFTLADYKLLPFKEQNYDNSDIFLPKVNIIKILQFYFYVLTSKDQFIITGWNNKYLLSILFLRRIMNLPYCFYTDSIDPEKYVGDKLIFIKKFLLSRAQFILTTGRFGVQKMIEAKIFKWEDRIISLPFFVKPPMDISQIPQNKNHIPYNFLVLARLVEWKGVDVAIDAFAILKSRGYNNITLKVGGVGPELNNLKAKTSYLNLDDLVTFSGWVDEIAKLQLVKSSIALIHPVRGHDPFPLVVNECLSMGLPVIGSNKAGSVIEFVKNGYNGFIVESDSALEIADAVIKIVEMNLEDYILLSTNASKLTEDWSSTIGINILRRLI